MNYDIYKVLISGPWIGYSPTELANVSIIAPSVMMADGLATALMVMDAKNGKKLIESMSGFEAYLITKNMEKLVTSSFPNS
ncbi:MAG: hypothetical protein HON98_13740 [Chloroflexi bacterium]|nr:hypothetical protein [Chloroflexota bacterium]MBT3671078.1 hypothetical protein [Chloroflexota bacterium]MBT4304893.1 hypothetical protein [Chloroflexota bacterium]MBT4534019.1 hypothetical protein [Chloroflexota bacterium]MBT4682370.1 hypothetical protein [Chloroflexota bacterium]